MNWAAIDYNTFGHLALEIVVVAGVICTLFYLRRRFGLAALAVFLGSNQYLAVLLASGIYFRGVGETYVSPGSAVFFAASLFAVLLMYLREDIPMTRVLIGSVVAVNVLITLFLWLTAWQMSHLEVLNLISLPVELFLVNPRVFLVGTVLLLVDFLLIVTVFQGVARLAPRVPQLIVAAVAMVAVLAFDSVVFGLVNFWGEEILHNVVRGQLIGKCFAGVLYAGALALYLHFVEPRQAEDTATLDIFAILTYRERYEIVRERLAKEQASAEARRKFLTHMSHELRTPLNAIIGFTGLLRPDAKRIPDTEARVWVERVHDNALHLLQLINGLLDLSKIESGASDIETAKVHLDDLVTRTLQQLEGAAREKGLRLTTDLPDKPVAIATDATKLKQVLINLVGNAIKFTHEGGVTVRVVAGSPGTRPTRLVVADTGVGIPESEFERIFDPFSQVETEPGSGQNGTGLGLAISRALCEQLGLRLEVASRQGEGSSFNIFFD